jgi:hypothetical protein
MHGHQVATADQSKAGRDSYMKNPHTSCLIALSGGDPKEPLLHAPPWASIFPSEALIGQIPEVQHLIVQRDEAVQRFNACPLVKNAGKIVSTPLMALWNACYLKSNVHFNFFLRLGL